MGVKVVRQIVFATLNSRAEIYTRVELTVFRVVKHLVGGVLEAFEVFQFLGVFWTLIGGEQNGFGPVEPVEHF